MASVSRVPGAGIEPAASTFRVWRTTSSYCPGVREGGFEPPPPDSKSGSLPVSRFPRAPRGSRTRLSDLGSPRLTARPGTHQPSLRVRDRGVEPRSPGWKPGVVPLDQSRETAGGRRGSRTLKAHRSPGFEPGAVAHRLALPNRRAPAAGIEPASPRLTAGYSYQHELHRNRRVRQSGWPDSNRRSPAPEAGGLARLSHIPSRTESAQRESNPHVRHGKAVGCRYIMGTFTVPRIVKEPRAPGGTRTHVAALRVRSPRRWTTSACIGVGPEGLEPSPNRLRAGRSAARTSVPKAHRESARKESNLRRPVISRVFSR